jgi:hypothetical protein
MNNAIAICHPAYAIRLVPVESHAAIAVPMPSTINSPMRESNRGIQKTTATKP